ncbi:MAG: 3-phosphoglycerate dehydrogenase, partial [Candidatus Bipolaricaulota bacterium]|nr:3-phosphoglycerate dehydrogenase [Candidatus Bipolaricaulota bacterium]
LDASAVKAMRDAGLIVNEKTSLTPDALLRENAEYDAIVVRSATKVRAEVIDAGARLKLIVRAGVGLDNVDAVHARKKGVEVRNTPSASSNSVAALALGHMLSLARHIGRGTASLKAGQWEKKQLEGVEIEGKTLGIIGIGRIGQSLARKAHALGMAVLCYDAFLSASPIPKIARFVPLDELLAESDFISLHIPYDAAKGPTLGEREIGRMKPGVQLINCARGGVVDEAALLRALESGKVAGAALDVFATEPPAAGDALVAAQNVSLTPHIGAATAEAQARVGDEAARIVIEFAKTAGR